jgi:hypothetical protein
MQTTKTIPLFDTKSLVQDANRNWVFGTVNPREPGSIIAAQSVGTLQVPTEKVRIVDDYKYACNTGTLVGVGDGAVLVSGNLFRSELTERVYQFNFAAIGFDFGEENRCKVKLKQSWIDNLLAAKGPHQVTRKKFADFIGSDKISHLEIFKGFPEGTFNLLAVHKSGNVELIHNRLFRESDFEVVSGNLDDYRVSLRCLYDEQLNTLTPCCAS